MMIVQHGNFSYDSPMKCLLEAIREQTLPTDLLDVLDQAGVKYYQGELDPIARNSIQRRGLIPVIGAQDA